MITGFFGLTVNELELIDGLMGSISLKFLTVYLFVMHAMFRLV